MIYKPVSMIYICRIEYSENYILLFFLGQPDI